MKQVIENFAKTSIVVHSGGMDSSICLALAIQEFGNQNVLSLGFDYRQRHTTELAAAKRICDAWGVDRIVLDLSLLGRITDNALVNNSLTMQGDNTLVVGRNGLMARLAAIYAQSLGVHLLDFGVIECDAVRTGYRDCSRAYWDMKQAILRVDLGDPLLTLRTPLVKMSKKETMAVADGLGVLNFLLEETITCYEGLPREGCGRCPACCLRHEGLHQYYNERDLVLFPSTTRSKESFTY